MRAQSVPGQNIEPWAATPDEVLEVLKADGDHGLSADEAKRRRGIYGPNELKAHKRQSVWQILADQVKSLIILLLAVAASVSFIYNEVLEGWAILVVIAINTIIGFFTELKAVRSMEALNELGRVETRVRRDGEVQTVDALDLVPGDIVLLEGGDIVTADLRILDSSRLQADESALTGESLPVAKAPVPVDSGAVLAERTSMLYKGTAVTRGSCEGVVVSTGLETELGQISSLVEEAEEERTPLEERLDKLGYRLIFLALLITAFITITGILTGKEAFLMIQTGIALAVAAIPEGLPIVATIALAKGMHIMAKKNALINRLSSVETLGATQTIFTDKTGTLTENRMSVTRVLVSGREIEAAAGFADLPTDRKYDEDVRMALETGVLCNNASLSAAGEGIGDPLEVALLEAGFQAGIEQSELLERHPEVREEAFDSEVKMMATWNKTDMDRYRISVKGAPGVVWEHCDTILTDGEQYPFSDEERKKWEAVNRDLAADGLRIIALAYRETDTTEGDPYEKLTFLGLAALLDPPREDVKAAIKASREAGIQVIMVTGDQLQTAEYIGKHVGLVMNDHATSIHGKDLPAPEELEASLPRMRQVMNANIFARISPRQKLDIIQLYQDQGYTVAMTGDGVNDAPALKKADIGIAMGQRGTQVAKEAADMVLVDDAFSTIVSAIKQGRIIFGNIRRFVYYLLSCNISEVLVVGLASVAGAPLPILPLQILFLNLVTDVFPALALGVGEGEEGIMQQPPRPSDEPVLQRKHWFGISGHGLMITGSVLGALYLGMEWLKLAPGSAVTLSFLTLAFAQLWHVFNMRGRTSGIFDNSIVRNRWVWRAIGLCILLILGALYISPVAEVMQLAPPGREGWLVVAVMSFIPLVVGQLQKTLSARK